MPIKSYIRRVLATGYVTINFIKFLKGSGASRACILNINSRKKRKNISRKLGKRIMKEERLYFPKPKK